MRPQSAVSFRKPSRAVQPSLLDAPEPPSDGFGDEDPQPAPPTNPDRPPPAEERAALDHAVAAAERAAALLADLNGDQRAAVEHRGVPLLIVAGAGSGKTRVLTRRIAYLLAAGGATPGEILAITFTNKAAAEMRERVAELIGGRSRAMWVSTFHSMCVRILRNEATHLGYKSSFTIYDAADSVRFVAMVSNDLDLDPKKFSPKGVAAAISNLKNELVDPATAADRADNDSERVIADVYARYQARLKTASALDFDDLIMETVALLQTFPAVAEHYRRRFRHVLVDEYQDTNHAQYTLVRELVGGADECVRARGSPTASPTRRERLRRGHRARRGLVVVGDADQSIYAFRGATIRNIVEFERDYPESPDDPAGAELPLHPEHPLRGERGHRPQPRPPGQEPVDGDRQRRADRRVRRRQRARRGVLRLRRDRPAGRRREMRGSPTSRCSTGRTLPPVPSRTSSCGWACRTRSSAGSASTSVARSRTRWPTCGRWPTRPTRCRCAGS